MNAANAPRFSFTGKERTALMKDSGRHDVAALALISDIEACLQAYDYSCAADGASAFPGDVENDLGEIVAAAAQLRSRLYRLPEEMTLLIDLHLLAEGARRRVTADLSQLIEPLEDIAGAIAEIRRSGERASPTRAQAQGRLIRALAMAFRNRLNRKPTWHNESGFPALLAGILAFAGERLPSIAELRAEMTTQRLRELLRDPLGSTQPLATAES